MKKLRLLYVDDDEGLAMIISRELKPTFDVSVMVDPIKALEYIQENSDNLDIVVSDYKMPGMNGLDLIMKIKTIRPLIKRVLLTGYYELIEADNRLNICDLVIKKSILKDTESLTNSILNLY